VSQGRAARRRTAHNGQVAVGREVATSAALSVAAIVLVSAGGVWAARTVAVSEAVHQAEQATELVATSVVAPAIDDALLTGDEAAVAALDDVVQSSVVGDRILTVRVWSPDGRILYSDDLTNIGQTFPLGQDELDVLATGEPAASLSDLTKQENADQSDFDQLLEVYVPIETPEGATLLFETYQSTEGLTDGTSRILRAFAPVILGGLLVFGVIQLLLSWRLARRLARAQAERERLLVEAVDASEQERRSIAADLHDGVVQDLVGLTFALDGLAGAADDARTAHELTSAAGTTRRSVRSLRSLLVEIYPPNLEEVGFAGAVTDLAAAASTGGLDVAVDVDPTVVLGPPREAAAYRAVREALSNVRRHAAATHVTVTLAPLDGAPGGGVLTVADDGAGFDPSTVESGHVGLRLLRDLAASVDARCEVSSAPGRGTTVRLEFA
jgi:signal transduction histidine kinase